MTQEDRNIWLRDFSTRLLNLLDERHITQTRLAEETGFTFVTVSSWIAGRTVPKATHMEILAKYFNVSLDYIHYGKESDVDRMYTQIQKEIQSYKDKEFITPAIANLLTEIVNKAY